MNDFSQERVSGRPYVFPWPVVLAYRSGYKLPWKKLDPTNRYPEFFRFPS